MRACGLSLAIGLASGLSLAGQQATPAPARSQWNGIYTDAQAKRGEPLYAENCAFCHGANLEGTISAPPLTGAALSAQWQGKSLADLFEYQQAFMPWTSPGGFSRAQNVDILAYILKKGGFPPGTELSSQPDAQRQIRIVPTK